MYDWPCIHRGEPTGEQVDCGCGLGKQPIYACNNVALGEAICTIRLGNNKNCPKFKRDFPNLLSCAGCNFREDPTVKKRWKPSINDIPVLTARKDGLPDVGAAMRQQRLASQGLYSPGPLIVDCDTHGFGDALIMAWIAEGAKGTAKPCFLRANGEKRELLRIFGQNVIVSDTATDQAGMVAAEQRDGFANPRLEFRAGHLGITATPKRPIPTLSPGVAEWAQKCIGPSTVLLAPESNHANREWPAANWLQLAKLLEEASIPFLVVAHRARPDYEHLPSIFGLMPLERVVGLFQQARAVVAIDSFPANLAGTLDVPTLCLLSFTTPQMFAHTPSVRCLSRPARNVAGMVQPAEVFLQLQRMLDVLGPSAQ